MSLLCCQLEEFIKISVFNVNGNLVSSANNLPSGVDDDDNNNNNDDDNDDDNNNNNDDNNNDDDDDNDVRDAQRNAEMNGVTNCAYFTGKAEDILHNILRDIDNKDIVAIVDPPRAGLHQKALKAIRSTLAIR